MDTLKHKFIIVLACFVIGNNISLQAQVNESVLKAFAESYVFENEGKYKKAADIIKTVYQESSYEINLRLGWLNYQAGQFNESVTHYRKSVGLMPLAIEGKFGLVYPLAAIGKWDEVENIYKEILSIAPNNTVANYRIGLLYYGQEKFQLALSHFKKVVDLFPFDYDGLIMYAWSNFKLGKNREAKILFQKALMLNPSDKSALEGLGYVK